MSIIVINFQCVIIQAEMFPKTFCFLAQKVTTSLSLYLNVNTRESEQFCDFKRLMGQILWHFVRVLIYIWRYNLYKLSGFKYPNTRVRLN